MLAVLIIAIGPLTGRALPIVVVGKSMQPSINSTSLSLVDVVGPREAPIARGDIVAASFLGVDYASVKRVIGIGGDHVVIEDGNVWLNGQELDEPYARGPTLVRSGPHMVDGRLELIVPPGHYFVLGDNRAGSWDSRSRGPVPAERILSRVWAFLGFDM